MHRLHATVKVDDSVNHVRFTDAVRHWQAEGSLHVERESGEVARIPIDRLVRYRSTTDELPTDTPASDENMLRVCTQAGDSTNWGFCNDVHDWHEGQNWLIARQNPNENGRTDWHFQKKFIVLFEAWDETAERVETESEATGETESGAGDILPTVE